VAVPGAVGIDKVDIVVPPGHCVELSIIVALLLVKLRSRAILPDVGATKLPSPSFNETVTLLQNPGTSVVGPITWRASVPSKVLLVTEDTELDVAVRAKLEPYRSIERSLKVAMRGLLPVVSTVLVKVPDKVPDGLEPLSAKVIL
jgi:hypothetical protein